MEKKKKKCGSYDGQRGNGDRQRQFAQTGLGCNQISWSFGPFNKNKVSEDSDMILLADNDLIFRQKRHFKEDVTRL